MWEVWPHKRSFNPILKAGHLVSCILTFCIVFVSVGDVVGMVNLVFPTPLTSVLYT